MKLRPLTIRPRPWGLLFLIVAAFPFAAGAESILLATTTSVRDSGLLEKLLPDFTQQTGTKVRVIAVGTGAALRMGREGNADVLLTHAPTAEQQLITDGIVRRRTPFMQNFFVIAGPKNDPAKIAAAPSPKAAFQAIASQKAPFVSRADDSGTHKKEKSLWTAAGLSPAIDWPGFARTGSGMGLSLQVAGEKQAYILSDIGTFLAFQNRTGLIILSQPSEALRNIYSVLQLDASKFGHPLNSQGAEALESYLVSPGVQARIAAFGKKRFGQALFIPLVTVGDTPSSALTPSTPLVQ